MKLRLISIMSAVVMLLTLVVGCAGTGATNPSGGKDTANENNAQLVVAMNPIFVYDDGETIIAYNDIKNAIKADFQGSTLTTMHQTTNWSWAYNTGDSWKKRDIYTLDNWTNGSGKEAKSAYSYSYNNEGTTSLASYSTQSTELTTYAATDTVSDFGLLLSVSSAEEEALTFTVQKDGMLNVAQGFITAVQAVSGVNTGFLAEDGTARSASFRMMVNGVQVFSGTLCNSTAAPDGQAVTSLNYDQISDLKVQAGNVVMIAVKLNATANTDEDQSAGEYNDEDNWTIVDTEVKIPVESYKPGAGDTTDAESKALSIFDNYESRFVLFRDVDDKNMTYEMLSKIIEFRSTLEYVLDAEVFLRTTGHDEVPYEIVFCPSDQRPESVKIYNELKNYRPNNANDYIVRRVGTKVYIAALNVVTLEAAFNHFIDTFCQDDKGAIPVDYNYAYQAPAINATVAGVNIGNYVIRVEKYPTTMVYRAAEGLRDWVLANCGYMLPIANMTDDGKHYEYEIQIGPMNGSVKVDRLYDTRFTSATIETVGKFSVDPSGFMEDKPATYYTASIKGKKLVINGGSSYSVNAAAKIIYDYIAANKQIPASFKLEGNYDPTTYQLMEGYSMQWQEEFSYSGSETDINKEMREYWTVSTDGANGPTTLSVAPDGTVTWDQQRRPGVYGQNWWQWTDKNTGNGYLVQVTKKESYGYDAGRLISQSKWSFRYGIFETRLVTGTRNGACSAVWTVTDVPDNATVRNEIDLYENFGRDIVSACLHTWQPDSMGGHKQHGTGTTHNVVYPAQGEHFYDTFHSIAIVWTPDLLIHLWDGVEYDRFDLTNIPSGQSSTTMKFACGVGTKSYARDNDPWDWMDAEYTALTGKTVDDFFEIQVVDYSYVFQTSNEGKNAVTKSYIKYDRSHPSSPYYKGYLSKIDGYQNSQLPAPLAE